MRLAWDAPRTSLGLGGVCGASFDWARPVPEDTALSLMRAVPNLSPHLDPSRLCIVRRADCSIGTPALLLKWKAPRVKWRLAINKHFAPCTGLHGIVGRVIGVALNNMPAHTWSDKDSPRELMACCCDFSARALQFFEKPSVDIDATDM